MTVTQASRLKAALSERSLVIYLQRTGREGLLHPLEQTADRNPAAEDNMIIGRVID
jgi:hypothetical protein